MIDDLPTLKNLLLQRKGNGKNRDKMDTEYNIRSRKVIAEQTQEQKNDKNRVKRLEKEPFALKTVWLFPHKGESFKRLKLGHTTPKCVFLIFLLTDKY